MSTLSLRKIKHDSSSIDNITLNSNGTTSTGAELIVPSLKGISGNKLQLRSGDSSYGVSLQNVSGIDLLNVDAVGRVTTPYQPCFSTFSINGAAVTTDTSYRVMPFGAVYVNVGDHYSTSTNRFTAPIAGKYMFCISVLQLGNISSHITLFKNGSIVVGPSSTWRAITGGTEENVSGQTIFDLSANDYVDVRYKNDGSGNMYGAHGSFSGFLLG